MKPRSARCRPFSPTLSNAPPAIPRPRKLALELLEDRALLNASPPNPHGLFPGEQFPVGVEPYNVALEDVNGDGFLDIVTDSSGISVLLGNGDGSFAAQATYAAESRGGTLTLQDINRDGFADLITSGSSYDSLSLLLGNGDGTFADQTIYAVGDEPRALALDDLNRDGFLDIATANAGSNNVSLLLSNGDGTFADQATYAVGAEPQALALDDLNRDGFLDIVTANAGSDNVSVLLGNGNGTFADQATYAAGDWPGTLILEDLNRDGILDIATPNGGSDTVSVLLGNGDGTFGNQTTYAVDIGPRSLAMDDLNRDGFVDIVTHSYRNVSILLGNGDGTFTEQATYEVGKLPWSLVLEDLNHDGFVDIVAATGEYPDNVSVLLANGDGTFADRASYEVTKYPKAIAINDLNDDGFVDLVTINSGIAYEGYRPDNASVLLGNGDGSFAAQATYAVGGTPELLLLKDLNRDGLIDIVAANRLEDNVSVLLGNGNGTFADQATYAVGDWPGTLTLEDLNGDGLPDVVTANRYSDDVSVLLGNGDGTFADQATYAVGDRPRSLAVEDLNYDGFLDIVTANIWSNDVSVLLGNGDGTFADQATYELVGQPQSLALEDLNRDGFIDIATRTTLSTGVSILLGNGDGTFAGQATYATSVGSRISLPLKDVTGDGWVDIVMGISGGIGGVSILPGNGDGTFGKQQLHFLVFRPSLAAAPVLEDLNRDGFMDIVMPHQYTGPPNEVSVLLGNGDGTFAGPAFYAVGHGARALELVDLNRDGFVDIVTANYYDHNVSVVLGNGDGTFSDQATYMATTAPRAVALEDLNGDGLLDIVTSGASISVLLQRVPIVVNQPPVAHFQEVVGVEDTATEITLTGSDDGRVQPLTFALAAAPIHGRLSDFDANTGQVTYTPDVNYNGPDSFTFTVNDGELDSEEATVTIDVAAVNDPPLVFGPIGSVIVNEDAADSTFDLMLVFYDVDILTNGDNLAFSVQSNDNGALVAASIDGDILTLDYLENQNGTAVIVVRATDTDGLFTEDTISLTVNPVNDEPTIVNPIGPVTVDEDTDDWTFDLTTVFDDVDIITNSDSLVFSVVANDNEGLVVASIADSTLTFDYQENQNGTATIVVRATDMDGLFAEETIPLTVDPVNDAPRATDDEYTVDQNEILEVDVPGVLDNDTDVDGDAISAVLVDGPAHGTLTLNEDGSFVYEPETDFNGSDSFTYKAYDGQDESSEATVVVNVTPIGVARLEEDPLYPGGKMLVVYGTREDDHILFEPEGNDGQIVVTLNDVVLGTFRPTSRLVAFAYEGNDNVQVAGSIGLPAWLYGNEGDDRLKGGAGHDLLFGGLGEDRLNGGRGRDLLVGEDGADRIVGNSDDDILIGGRLSFDNLDEACRAITEQWTSAADYRTRVLGLSDPTQEFFLRLGQTVLEDEDTDRLTGSSGQDWFCSDLTYDRATDLKNEISGNNASGLPAYHSGMRPVYHGPPPSAASWLHQYEQRSTPPQPPRSHARYERAIDVLLTSGWLGR